MCSVDSSGVCVYMCMYGGGGIFLEQAILQGPVDTSEQTSVERTNAWSTAGCLMHHLQRFIPAAKAVKISTFKEKIAFDHNSLF